jgi:PAS domain S-box-containing protein
MKAPCSRPEQIWFAMASSLNGPPVLDGVDFFQRVIDAVPQPIFVKDGDSHFVAINLAMCALMGRNLQALIGRTDYDFVPKEQADVFRAKDLEVLNSGVPNENEEVLTDPHGQVRTIVTSKYRVLLPGGRRFIVGCITDLTELRQSEARARQVPASEALIEVRNRVRFERALAEARAAAIQLTLHCFTRGIPIAALSTAPAPGKPGMAKTATR